MKKGFIFVTAVVFGFCFVIPSLLEIHGNHYAASVVMAGALIAVFIHIPLQLLRLRKENG